MERIVHENAVGKPEDANEWRIVWHSTAILQCYAFARNKGLLIAEHSLPRELRFEEYQLLGGRTIERTQR